MTSVQIKDVPNDVRAVLRSRAALEGQSLQEYLLTRLSEDARTPTVVELFARIEHRSGGTVGFAAAVEAIRADRDDR